MFGDEGIAYPVGIKFFGAIVGVFVLVDGLSICHRHQYAVLFRSFPDSGELFLLMVVALVS